MRRRTRTWGLLEVLSVVLTAAVILIPPVRPSAPSGPAVLSARPIPFDPTSPSRRTVGALRYLGGASLSATGLPQVHGLSGLEAEEGSRGSIRLTAVTDDGGILRFHARMESATFRVAPRLLLRRIGGDVGGKRDHDAEGLTLASREGGRYALAFERRHRIEMIGDPFNRAAAPVRFIGPAGLAGLPANGGVEALALLPLSGREVLAVGAEDGRIWFCDLVRTSACTLFHAGTPYPGFRLTSLDHLPGTADLVAVYRAYDPVRGMRSLVARLDTGVTGRRRTLTLARLERPVVHGNFEGVAALDNGRGGWTLYLVSDDGFPPGSPTLLLAFDYTPRRVPPPPSSSGLNRGSGAGDDVIGTMP